MEQSIITWNIANWITVVLMAALGYLVFLLLFQAIGKGGMGGGIAPVAPPNLMSQLVGG